jgi:transcriptional regulator with XRE-family HTH domain
MIRLQSRDAAADHRSVATLYDILAANIRGERARRRWTQAQLAERLGWPRTSIHDVEVGRRRLGLDDLEQLCTVLDVPLIDLCRGADPARLRTLGLN